MRTYRYTPDSVMCLTGNGGQMQRVAKAQFIPVSARVKGDYPIVPTMGVLVLTTTTGYKRVWGMDHGQITSDLRFIVSRDEWTSDPDSCRDEVIRSLWPLVEVID